MTQSPTTPKGSVCAAPRDTTIRRSHLSAGARRLLGLTDHVWYGRVEDLLVRGGEPSFDRPPRVTRTLKLVGNVDPRPAERPAADPVVTPEQLALLAHLRQLGDGLVRRVEVSRGTPLFVEVYDPPPLGVPPAAAPSPRAG